MDESSINHAINTAYWISGASAFLLVVNGGLVIYLATKVAGLSKGIEKFFQWFDNRPCERHNVLIEEIVKKVDGHETRIGSLERREAMD